MIWFFLLSGLFLGWSLGANDAANIFGTAVGSRMVRFKVAALIASIFVVLGAVFSGEGTTETLGALGAVNALAGSFTVALAAALTVTWMTRLKLPVSTSQAVVGAIVGWNLFTGMPTDLAVLGKIMGTWVFSPLLAAVAAMILFFLARAVTGSSKTHILQIDAWTRLGLIVVGAFGAYSLGANNIANVMGVFVPASPFKELNLLNGFSISSTQQLFLLGAGAIAVGIYTYSHRVMTTVGNEVFKLTPLNALIVVLASSLVLFLFASRGLKDGLTALGLPSFPLVPVSSSQAIVGAIIGVALAKGGKGVNYRVLGRIASGWITTPVLAAAMSFVALFFVQNVFEQEVALQDPRQKAVVESSVTLLPNRAQEVDAKLLDAASERAPGKIQQPGRLRDVVIRSCEGPKNDFFFALPHEHLEGGIGGSVRALLLLGPMAEVVGREGRRTQLGGRNGRLPPSGSAGETRWDPRFTRGDHALNQVLEFTHIPRPRMALQILEEVGVEARGEVLGPVLLKEVRREERQVFAPIS
jgi:PiT family inorganic phosphate transporter